MRKFLSVLCVLAACQAVQAAVTISVTGPGGTFTTPTEDSPGSKRWTFSVTKTAVSGNANPTVFQVTTSDPADVIKLVTMKSQAPNEVLQLELGTGPSNRVGEIGEVKIGTDAADDDGQAHVLIYSEARAVSPHA